MKLTKERLNELILEVLNEHRGQPMKDRGIKGQIIAKEREQENAKRTRRERERKDRLMPGMRELVSLSRGVINENDLGEEDEEGFIKVKKDAFLRLLKENKANPQQVMTYCNQRGYKSMEQWLRITNAFADAGKGKFGEEK